MLHQMTPRCILYMLQLWLLSNELMAVKIGVSKLSTTTTTMIANTTTEMATTEAEVFTTIATTEELTTTTRTPTTTTTPATISTKATTPIFVLPEFPPRKTKTSLRTTTQKPTTTTSTTTTTTTTVKPPTAAENEQAENLHAYTGNYYCACNLLMDACDINCCCDRDCSREAIQVYNCHIEQQRPVSHDWFNDFQYQHGLPSCKINDGWLCVFRTNIGTEQKTKVVSANLDSTSYKKWPNLLPNMAEESTESSFDFYKYGEPLKLLNMETLELQTFDLPYAFKPPYCQLEEPIRYLKSQRSFCLVRSAEELQETKRKLLQVVTTTKLLVKPTLKTGELEKVNENLLDFQMQQCLEREESGECIKLQLGNVTNDYDRDNFYTTGINIKILHNYTHIMAAAVELREQLLNNVEDAAESMSLWQTYELQFIYKNYTDMTTEPQIDLFKLELEEIAVSGALGYLAGAPIIMAKFIPYNESRELTPYNRILNYFHANATKLRKTHSLPLFTRRQELCYKNSNSAQLISYGINTLKQCKLRLSNETLATRANRADLNFTAICVRLQQLAWQQLYFDNGANMSAEQPPELVYISQLGKPQNKSEKWTLLYIRNYEYTPITAQYNEQAQSFSCHNVVLSVAYEFFIGTFTEQGVPRQALVQQAALIVGARHDLEFSVHELLEVPLTVSVMFYDYNAAGVAGSRSVTSLNTSLILYLCLSLVLKLVSN